MSGALRGLVLAMDAPPCRDGCPFDKCLRGKAQPCARRNHFRRARESAAAIVMLGPPVSPRCVKGMPGATGCFCDDPYHSHGRHHCRCGNEWFDGETDEMVAHRLNPQNDPYKDVSSYHALCKFWFPEHAATGFIEEKGRG